MPLDTYTLLLGALGALVLTYCVVAIRLEPHVGLALVAVVAVLEGVLGQLPSLTVGAIRWYVSDLVYVALVVSAMVPRRRLLPLPLPVVAFAAAVGFSLLRGVLVHGPNLAGNEARVAVGFVCVLIFVGRYSGSFDAPRVVRIARIGLGSLLLVCAVRWATGGIGSAGAALLDSPIDQESRALPSFAAVLVASAFVALLYPQVRAHVRRPERWLGATLVATVLLQHRSIWLAFAVGVASAVATSSDVRDFAAKAVRHVPLAAVAFAAVLSLGAGAAVIPRLTASTQEVANERGSTFGWRQQSNAALLEMERDALETAIGKPFGTGWDRRISTAVVTVSPHNAYLEYFLRTGLFGLSAFVGLLVLPLVRARQAQLRHSPTVPLIVLVSVYGLAYGMHPTHALIVGACLCVSNDQRQEPAQRRKLSWQSP